MLSYFSKMLCNLSRAPWDSGWYALDLNCFIIKACLTCWSKIVKVLIIVLALIFLSGMASGIDGGSHKRYMVALFFCIL
jgi:hypothetical protein